MILQRSHLEEKGRPCCRVIYAGELLLGGADLASEVPALELDAARYHPLPCPVLHGLPDAWLLRPSRAGLGASSRRSAPPQQRQLEWALERSTARRAALSDRQRRRKLRRSGRRDL